LADFLSNPVWLNPNFRIAGKSFEFKHYLRKGITFVNDFVNEYGLFLSFQEFQGLFDVNSNFLEYEGIIHSFRKALTDCHVKQNDIKVKNQILPITIQILTKCRKGCRAIYDVLVNNNRQTKSEKNGKMIFLIFILTGEVFTLYPSK
jgi:hypothetical protein